MKSLTLALVTLSLAHAQPRPPAQPRDLLVQQIEEESAPAKHNIPTGYAVVIGISRYRNLGKDQQLRFAEQDARAIKTVLISEEGGNFKIDNVHVLLNEQATLQAIRKEI